MRKFRIKNETGQTIDLQGGTAFFWQPSGLGFENDAEYEESNGYFLVTSSKIGQVEKSGTLVFKPKNAYADYKAIMDFLTIAKTITLEYKPYGSTWYACDVNISTVEKGELTAWGTLEVPIVFMPISPIYTPQTENFTISGNSTVGKTYTYRYSYKYGNAAQAGTLNLTIDAQMYCDFALEIVTAVSAPVFTVTNTNTGKVIGRIDLSAISVQDGQTVRFATRPTEAGAVLIDTDGTKTDLTPFIGLSVGVPTFFQLPPNTPLKIALSATSLEDVVVNFQIYKYYRTV